MSDLDLAARINAAHQKVVRASASMVEHAIEAGNLLLQVKESLGHGRWLPWVETHCVFSERTAQRYTLIARGRKKLEGKYDTVADLSLGAICKLIQVKPATRKKSKLEKLMN